ncbi:MAG: undecaprenyl-diphosphate phosphatase [Oscillospiraceae bacterium]|nr:undecaprenyl-diphosphate phosphatase [Oscillospiraceae bacterium]
MSVWISLLLGVVQGATEFLPVSSSGHLAILQAIFTAFGAELPAPQDLLLFDILLHAGTLTAVIIAFHRDVAEIAGAFFSLFSVSKRADGKARPAQRLLLLIVLATLPILAVGVFASTFDVLTKNLYFVGAALIGTGSLLYIADRVAPGKKADKTARVSDAMVVGLFQAIAIIPGLSRSGATISAGLMRGFDRKFAVKFSFLMSIPAIVGATVLHVFEAVSQGEFTSGEFFSYIPGMIAAGVVGYFAIAVIKRLVAAGRFGVFAYYCAAVGVITLFLEAFLPKGI